MTRRYILHSPIHVATSGGLTSKPKKLKLKTEFSKLPSAVYLLIPASVYVTRRWKRSSCLFLLLFFFKVR